MYIIGNGVIGEELVTSFKNKKKNLLRGAKWVKGFAEYNDEISNNSRFPNALSTEKLIRVNAKNTYHTNMGKNKDDYRIRTFDINKNRTGTGFDYINTDGTISLPEGTVYIRVMSMWRQNVEELYIKEVQTDENSENLIKDINTPKTFTFGSNAFLGVQKDYTGLLKINKTYTIGFKIKAENAINANFRICKINTWTSVHSNMQKVEPNGDYVDVRYTFISSLEDCRVALGAYNYIKGETFSIKDMFLIQGDYTNKKLPDSLFK